MYTASVKSVAASILRDPLGEILLLVTGILMALCVVSPALAQDGTANVRMVHLSPDAPDVMVELDGQPVDALADVGYGDASPYLQIPAGPHEISVYATADEIEPVLEVEVAPEAGSSYTIAGIGLLADDTFGATLFEDDTTPPGNEKTNVRVIHAIPDVGAATVSVEDGPRLFALPGFGNASDYAEVDPGTYTLDVTPAGADAPAFSVEDISIAPDSTYTAFAVGEASQGTVGTIITDDSDDGKIVAVTGNAPNPTGVGIETLSETGGPEVSSIPSATDRSNAVEAAVAPTQEPAKQTEAAPAVQSGAAGTATPVSGQTSLLEAAAPVATAPEATPVQNEAPVVTQTQAVAAYVPTPAPTQSAVQDITTNVYANASQNVAAITSGGAVIPDVSITQGGVNVGVPNTGVSIPAVDVQETVNGVVQGTPVNTAPVTSQPVVPVATPVSTPAPQQVVSTAPVAGGQGGGAPVEVPVQPVQAVVNAQATVINSGARRRFVYGR